jgi:hydrogenase nickel incorporation protein HypA/HybF
MHELGIANSILATVRKEADRGAHGRVVTVGIQLGELSGVNSEALAFGLETLVKNTELDPLEFHIETTRRRNLCSDCKNEFDVVDHDTTCPQCGEQLTRLIGGDEIVIAYYEFEE